VASVFNASRTNVASDVNASEVADPANRSRVG
jgi:hypothetical protein